MASPSTVDEFFGLNPGERVKFALALGEKVTAEVVTLVIYTYLTTPMAERTRDVYRGIIEQLVRLVDPIELYVLANRHVNTSKAPAELLRAHQYMGPMLYKLVNDRGLHTSYVRHDHLGYYCGTLSRRVFPTNNNELVAAGMKIEDGLIYNPNDMQFDRRTGRRSVAMILAPNNNELPTSLGL